LCAVSPVKDLGIPPPRIRCPFLNCFPSSFSSPVEVCLFLWFLSPPSLRRFLRHTPFPGCSLDFPSFHLFSVTEHSLSVPRYVTPPRLEQLDSRFAFFCESLGFSRVFFPQASAYRFMSRPVERLPPTSNVALLIFGPSKE